MPMTIRLPVERERMRAGPASACTASRRARLSRFRIVLTVALVCFLLGALNITVVDVENILALSFFALIAWVAVMVSLPRDTASALPVWLLAAVFFLGYFPEYIYLTVDPHALADTDPILASRLSAKVLSSTYQLLLVGFCVFCLSAAIPMRRANSGRQSTTRLAIAPHMPDAVLGGIVLVEVVSAYLMWTYGVGIMWADAPSLPYRMAGFLYYTRVIFLPAFLLLLFWLNDHRQAGWRFPASVGLLLLHGLLEALLRGSRGAILHLFLQILFLLLVTGKMTRRRFSIGLIALSSVILAYPLITAYRTVRAMKIEASPANVIAFAYDPRAVVKTLPLGVRAALHRVNPVFMIISNTPQPLGLRNIGKVTRKLNTDLYHLFPGMGQGAGAATLLGWFYLLEGLPGVIIGLPVFITVARLVWRALLRSSLFCRPIALVMFGTLYFGAITDCVLEMLPLQLLVTVATLACIELFLRPLKSRPHSPPRPDRLRAGQPPAMPARQMRFSSIGGRSGENPLPARRLPVPAR